MIDVHVLTHSGTRPDWLAQCLASLQGQPCTVHVVTGVEGSVGAGRAMGYAMGHHEFVAYVDSDDYILPGALAACLRSLAHYRAVVTREWVEYEDGSRHPVPKPGHCLTVYRREDVAPYLPAMAVTPHSSDMRMRQLLAPTQLRLIGYVWRVHTGGDHRNLTPETFAAESAAWPSTAS